MDGIVSVAVDKPTQTTLGAVAHKDGVRFGVWAPFAESVAVTGSFNEWSPDGTPLERGEDGCWYGDVPGAKVGQEYKFVIKNGDKTLQRNDPRALQLSASNDTSIIVSQDFDWTGDSFELPPREQLVIYELHIGTFNRPDPATPGTFETATEKLGYLADLGVNVIEVMPVSTTTVDRWWGYDPDYLFATEASYGGRHAFQEFVKAAHALGIGVFVDVVYNHMSPYPGLDLWQFDGWSQDGKGGIYFYNDWRGDSPWGPRFDYGRPEVRRYITESAAMWLRDCHVDGLRVDATFAIRNVKGFNNDPHNDLPDGWRVMQELTAAAHEAKPESLVIAEDMAINEFMTKPSADLGAGFDAQWESSFPTFLREVLNPAKDDDRHLTRLRDELTKTYNGDAFQRVLFSESHDADANGHARMNQEISPDDPDSIFARRRSTLAAALCLTGTGIPMLFQGQEMLEEGWFNHWDAIDWGRVDQYHGTVQLYKDLIALRRNRDGHTAGLQGQSIKILEANEKTKVLAYHRQSGDADPGVIFIANLVNQQCLNYSVHFPQPGLWKVRLNSDWKGYSEDYTETPTPDVSVEKDTGSVNLGPYSFIILSQDKDA